MSLRTRLREWLGITQFEQDLDEGSEACDSKLFDLQDKFLDLNKQVIDVKELLRMPFDFRLAQARNSLMLLTSFINEIQRDLDKQNEENQNAKR